jgi:hypothetical protein
MQLKLKLAAIASSIALAASMGVILAGPAAAATNSHICVNDSKGVQACAFTYPNNGDNVPLEFDSQTSTPWDTPSVQGQISTGVNLTSLCMQVHPGYTILINNCTGISSQRWTAEAGVAKGTTIWISVSNPNYCLNADPYSSPPVVNAAKCSTARNNVNQEWYQIYAN